MTPPDIQALEDQLDAVERDARKLVSGLNEELGAWRSREDSWSVAECLDHLAIGNRIYLSAMQAAAQQARKQGRGRRSPAKPGLIGRWFAGYLEPPARAPFKTRAPRSIRPRKAPALSDAFDQFIESHHQMRTFLNSNADLDLAKIRFVNPFIRGVRFSLATGLHVIPAHERRHLWQAWRVRRAAEENVGVKSAAADSKP
ncbi:MAG TPA: DinB family protein [Candidatus Angelobacter sp.]|nr:DinB family protein [Candidatus Angelobacter sp.]